MSDSKAPTDNPFKSPKYDGQRPTRVPKPPRDPWRRFFMMYGIWGVLVSFFFVANALRVNVDLSEEVIIALELGVAAALTIAAAKLTGDVADSSIRKRNGVLLILTVPSVVMSLLMVFALASFVHELVYLRGIESS